MLKKTQENNSFFLFFLSSGYCLLRFKVSLGDETVEKTQENHRFLIGHQVTVCVPCKDPGEGMYINME